MFSMEVVRDLLKRMQETKIVAVEQKEGGTQLKLIIDFEVHIWILRESMYENTKTRGGIVKVWG